MCFLTLSDPDSEETEEAEECCWGLEMDIGESALCGDTESLCCSSDPTPLLSTQESDPDPGCFGGETIKQIRVINSLILHKASSYNLLNSQILFSINKSS